MCDCNRVNENMPKQLKIVLFPSVSVCHRTELLDPSLNNNTAVEIIRLPKPTWFRNIRLSTSVLYKEAFHNATLSQIILVLSARDTAEDILHCVQEMYKLSLLRMFRLYIVCDCNFKGSCDVSRLAGRMIGPFVITVALSDITNTLYFLTHSHDIKLQHDVDEYNADTHVLLI